MTYTRQFSSPASRRLAVSLDAVVAQIALRDAGEAHRIVVGQHHLQALAAILVGGLLFAGLNFDQADATAEDAGRLARGIALDAARLSVGDLEVLVDAAEL